MRVTRQTELRARAHNDHGHHRCPKHGRDSSDVVVDDNGVHELRDKLCATTVAGRQSTIILDAAFAEQSAAHLLMRRNG